MKLTDITKYFEVLKYHNLSIRVDDISRYVFERIFDTTYGKRFLKKEEFLKEFNMWARHEFIDWDNNARLDLVIPNGCLVDAKLVDIPWVHPSTKEIIMYPLWLVEIHKSAPYINDSNGNLKKVNAVCKTCLNMEYIEDEELGRHSTNVGVIIYSNIANYGNSFVHVIKHEIVHFATLCIINDISNGGSYPYWIYEETDKDEFSRSDVDEFLADLVPYCMFDPDITCDDIKSIALKNFRKDLYIKFNPKFSDLYERILKRVLKEM